MEKLFTFDTPILNLTWYADPSIYSSIHNTILKIQYNNTAANILNGFEITKYKMTAVYPNLGADTYVNIGLRPLNMMVLRKMSLINMIKMKIASVPPTYD